MATTRDGTRTIGVRASTGSPAMFAGPTAAADVGSTGSAACHARTTRSAARQHDTPVSSEHPRTSRLALHRRYLKTGMSTVVPGKDLSVRLFRVPSDVIAARTWFTHATSGLPFSKVIA